jgi:hypothetical protein
MTEKEKHTLNQNRLELKFRFVLGIICIILFILIVFYEIFLDKKEYEKISKYESFNLEVESLTYYKDETRIQFIQGVKRAVSSPPELGHFLKIGDLVSKNENNDTVKILRNGEKYFFVIGQELNWENN